MKKIIIVSLFLFAFVACDGLFSNCGFESEISFDSEGGEVDIDRTDQGLPNLVEFRYNTNELDNPSFLLVDGPVSYDWVTVESDWKNRVFIIKAMPNETGHPRKIYVGGMVCDLGFEICVRQK